MYLVQNSHVAPYLILGNDLTKFRKPVAQIMKDSGITYKLQANGKELVCWLKSPVDFGKLTAQNVPNVVLIATDD
jgi:hypothetical protein